MGKSSYAPARIAIYDFGEEDLFSQPLPRLRISRIPTAHAVITMALVEDTFRSLGTQPPGRPDNDTLSEDELFAIFSARVT